MIIGEQRHDARTDILQKYSLVQVAKYYGVPPWVLLEQGVFWKDLGMKIMTAESEAQQVLDQHANLQNGRN